MAVRGINKVILVGRLGKDPEVRYIPNGGAVANLQVATSESWRDKQTGEIREQTEWHRVVLFGKLAEVAGEHPACERFTVHGTEAGEWLGGNARAFRQRQCEGFCLRHTDGNGQRHPERSGPQRS